MTTISAKRFFFLILPALCGMLFFLAVKLDHSLFRNGTITARGAIGIELLAILLFLASGLISVVAAFGSGKKAVAVLIAIVAVLIGAWLVVQGLDSGSALLYAT